MGCLMPSSDCANARAKPRGSVAGLQKRQIQIASQTRVALKKAYDDLLSERGDVPWKKIELARRAGLKSTVPLHAEINSDVLLLFNQHNADVLGRIAEMPLGPDKINDLDRSSSAVALLDAEVVELLKENAVLRRKISALERRLNVQKITLHR